VVEYGEGGGVGFDGKLSDAKIEEAGVDHFDPIYPSGKCIGPSTGH
jgi:hypothetical protein